MMEGMGKTALGTGDWIFFISTRLKRNLILRFSSKCFAFSAGTPKGQNSCSSRSMSSAVRTVTPVSHLGQIREIEKAQSSTQVSIEIVTTLQSSRRALEQRKFPKSSVDRPLHPLVSIRVAPDTYRPKLGLLSLSPSASSTSQRKSVEDFKTAPFSTIFSHPEIRMPVNDDKLSQEILNGVGHGSPDARQPYPNQIRRRGREASPTYTSMRGRVLVDEICNILRRPDNWHQLLQMDFKFDTYHVGEVLKRQDDLGLALSFFDWVSTQPDYQHNKFTYHTMIKMLTRSRNFDQALLLVDQMFSTGCKPDVVTFTILISGFGAANELQAVLEVLQIMRAVGCRPNVVTYNVLISIYTRSSMYDEAWDLFTEMKEEGVQANEAIYSSMINCLGKAGQVSAAKELFAEMKASGCVPDVITYTAIIDLHSKAGLYQDAITCYREMETIGLKPDIVILCAVMDCLGKAGDVMGANRVFEDLKSRGYLLDVVAYTNIITINGKAGFHEKAVGLFNEMREMGVQPNIVNYNSILDCLGKAGDVKAASMIHQEMKTLGCVPDLKTYSILMCLYAKLGLQDACLQLFDEVQQAGLQPGTAILVAMIDCLGKVGNFHAALSLFSEIKGQGYMLNVVCYTRMIDICAKCGHYDKALDFYREMQQAGIEPNIFTYNALIHGLGKCGNTTAAQNLFVEMQQRGCKPNIVTYNTLIDLYSKAGKPHLSLEIFAKLEADNLEPDSVTFITMMEALSRAGHPSEAEVVFKKMEEAGYGPKRPAYNILIDAWGKLGNLKKVDHWHMELAKSGLTPDAVTAKSLIIAYLRSRQYDSVRQAIEALCAAGFSDDCCIAAILLQHCSALDQQEHIESMLRLLEDLGLSSFSFVQKLRSSCVEEVEAHCRNFLDSLHGGNKESKTMFLDALIWFLHSQKRDMEAGHVWDYAMANGYYPQAVVVQKERNHWAMDLHCMSVGTAIVALTKTLANFRDTMVAQNFIPSQVSIITGWGRGSKILGCSAVKQAVQDRLDALGSPFYVDKMNSGCLVCSGESFSKWVKQL